MNDVVVERDALNLAQHQALLGYNKADIKTGIVHIGPGAFHRGHQAAYTHEALKLDPNWGICGVQMRSQGVRDALASQDNLYTLALLDHKVTFQPIGAFVELLSAKEHIGKVLAVMSAPTTHIFSTTVTEKGYCLTPSGNLDQKHTDIQHDLENPSRPISVIGLIVEALRLRQEAGYADVTVIPCDNMSENGERLRTAVIEYAELLDQHLALWIAQQIAFPSTMVDSITPATTDALRKRVAEQAGWDDAWPISREAFTQWVIEDKFSGPRPPWEKVGVEFTERVDLFEKAKLRLLNGTHSSLAYLGLLSGFETVGDAMREPVLDTFLLDMMKKEIIPTLGHIKGFDYASYSESILDRYRNPEIVYLLAQIAWDSSQKVPFRLLQTIEEGLDHGHVNQRQILAVAAWLQFLRRSSEGKWTITDPLKDQLLALAAQTTGKATEDITLMLGLEQVFSAGLRQSVPFRAALSKAYDSLEGISGSAVLEQIERV